MASTSGSLGSKYAALGGFILGAVDYGTDFSKTVSDSVTVSETRTGRNTSTYITVNDTATANEDIAVSRIAAQGVYTGVLGSSYALLGSVVLGDLDPQISPYSRSVSDDITVSETILGTNSNRLISVNDTVTVTDTIAFNRYLNVSVSDTATVATTITARNSTIYLTVSDSVNASETITGRDNTVRISVSDTVHTSDVAFGRNNTIRITVTDSVGAGEGRAARDNTAHITVSSLVHVTDTTVVRDTINRRTITDTVHVTETIFQISPNVQPTDHVTVHENISFTTSFVFLTVHDNVLVTEIRHCNPLDMAVTDHVVIDSRIRMYTSPFLKAITEPVTVKEKIVGHAQNVPITVADTTLVTEVIQTNRPLYRVTDNVTVTDSIITSPHVPFHMFDTVTVHDTVHSLISPIRVKDTIHVTEKIFEYSTNVFITVTDSIHLYDTVFAKNLAVQRLVERLNVTETIHLSNARQLVFDTAHVTENIRFSPVHIYVSDTITASESLKRLAFLVQDSVSVSERISFELDLAGLIQKLSITDTVQVNQIVHRTVTDHVQATEYMNLHGSIRVINIVDYLPINDAFHPRTVTVGGKKIIVPDFTGVIVNPKLMQLTTEDAQIQLPAALFGDSREIVGQVNIVKAMEGTTRQFIQATPRLRLTYRWRLSHIKVYELRAFVIASLSKIVTIVDWNGVVYSAQIVKNPFEFDNEGVYKNEKEFAVAEIVFEGIKTSGD